MHSYAVWQQEFRCSNIRYDHNSDRASSRTMSSITVTIKPTSGGDKFQAEIQTSATVRDLKEEVARKCDTAADQQRLIYKGQVLKDDRTVDSYGKLLLGVLMY